MDISYLSLLIFIIITIVYFAFPSFGKSPVTLKILEDNDLPGYYSRNLSSLLLYFVMIIVSQFFINSIYLINKCGGSAGKNIGAGAIITFVPWIFIFGVLIGVLVIFPGLKTPFADTIGYFAVASKANDIFAMLFNNESNQGLEKANELILKICENKSVLINYLNPENFLSTWNSLLPIMKNNGNIPGIEQLKQQLLDLTVLRDNIGEGMWYIYSAVLISSIVSYNLASRGCVKDLATIKASHDEYLKQNEETAKNNEINDSTPLTLS